MHVNEDKFIPIRFSHCIAIHRFRWRDVSTSKVHFARELICDVTTCDKYRCGWVSPLPPPPPVTGQVKAREMLNGLNPVEAVTAHFTFYTKHSDYQLCKPIK
jgi:hypothetical protein